ncbi:hypothetical protein SK642_1641 [Streptococcus mitis]|uniref:Uncharacterized protein n=1 Tax=Streptococcus mitis TaxID=28037 RepID=A0A081Q986_STRMT|nr:hypothetical protein SK642_1641 [Streptococcus mitis]
MDLSHQLLHILFKHQLHSQHLEYDFLMSQTFLLLSFYKYQIDFIN